MPINQFPHFFLGPNSRLHRHLPHRQSRRNFLSHEMVGIKHSSPHPLHRRSTFNPVPTFLRSHLKFLCKHKSVSVRPCHRVFEHESFDYEYLPNSNMEFHETKRRWEAGLDRDSIDAKRSQAYQANQRARRRHSTLTEYADHFRIPPLELIHQRPLYDRKERKRERQYTSSAFDTTKNAVNHPQKSSPPSSDPKSSSSSSRSPSTNSTFMKGLKKCPLTIEIPEQRFGPKVPERGSVDVLRARGTPYPGRDECNSGNKIFYPGNHALPPKHAPIVSPPRQMFRVTSNFEHSSRNLLHPSTGSFQNGNPLHQNALSNLPWDMNGFVSDPKPEKRMHNNLEPSRHGDRTRLLRDAGLSARVSPRGPNAHIFAGRPTRNYASQEVQNQRFTAGNRVPTGTDVVKTLEFEDANAAARSPEARLTSSQKNCHSPAGSSIRLREDSTFSQLSAQSWMSVETEESLTEREANLLAAKSSRNGHSNRASSSGGRFVEYQLDYNPATLFGVDIDGNVLERISNDDTYSLSVIECCAVIQIGAYISKKLGFNRYEQRRVWMSSDFLRLCWTSKKSGVTEDHIKLSQVSKIRLTDRTLTIDVMSGYGLCLVFPSVTSAGLWVRSLACLVPLQAQIKVPLGVSIASEKEREEFSLSEDNFYGKPIREYLTVNDYVALCNPAGTPQHLGLKMAFSFSDASFYGFRYIPRHSLHYMLRTKKEIVVLKLLNHPNVVKYYDCLEDSDLGGMYVAFEHLSRGCLADSNRLQRMQIFTEPQVRMIMMDVVDALLYLHSMRITHADVRPENILMAPNGSVKLNPIGCIMNDFNHIENRTAHIKCRLGTSSTAFLAPEQCWLSKAPKGSPERPSMDIWGVGAIMYTLLYGKTPFQGSTNNEIQENICWSTMRFPIETPISKEAKSLMFQILSNKDPRTRMTVAEVRDHPWFTDYKVLSPTSPRRTFSEFFDDSSSGDGSPLMTFSQEEIDTAVQPAKVRVTARKKKQQSPGKKNRRS